MTAIRLCSCTHGHYQHNAYGCLNCGCKTYDNAGELQPCFETWDSYRSWGDFLLSNPVQNHRCDMVAGHDGPHTCHCSARST